MTKRKREKKIKWGGERKMGTFREIMRHAETKRKEKNIQKETDRQKYR